MSPIADSVILAGAVLAALAYLVRVARLIFRKLDAAERILERELNGASGGEESLKSDVYGIAVSLGRLERRLMVLESWARTHPTNPLLTQRRHHP